MPIAYVLNLYPGRSHPFVRREIAALEARGQRIERFSIRPQPAELIDPDDRAELARTRVVLEGGFWRTCWGVSRALGQRPRRFALAFALACEAGWNSERGLLRHWGSLAAACVLRDWLEQAGCTHVHAHFESSTAVAMLSHALGGCTYSFTVHGPEEFADLGRRGLSMKLERARFVVAISDHCKDLLVAAADRELASKLHVLRCGVDSAFLAAHPTPVPDVKRLVTIGRLVPRKGHALLIEAAAALAAEGHVFEISILGDGELRAELARSIAEHGLDGRVVLAGWSGGSQVREALVQARALVLPSLAEGLPVTIMEAFALGRPVLATRVAAIPELVDATCGWLIAPGSVAALTRALRSVLETPVTELTAMGRAGRERVAALHDVGTTARALERLFAL